MPSGKRSRHNGVEGKCLTIDLDYWTSAFKTPRPYVYDFLKKCIQSTKRLEMIDSHELILDYIDDSFSTVINIDYHNDILGSSVFKNCGLRKEWLNEGTWGNYLPSSVTEFIWYYPSYKSCIILGEGLCEDEYGNSPDDYPINVTSINDCRKMKDFSSDLLVICRSRDWDYYDNLDKYLKWIDDIV